MRVQATNVMAKELNKRLKGNYCIDRVILEKIPHKIAYATVGGGYFDCDIDFDTDTVKVLKVIYKADCYAMPQYVTTGELGKLFRDGMTMEDLVEEFKRKYEI